MGQCQAAKDGLTPEPEFPLERVGPTWLLLGGSGSALHCTGGLHWLLGWRFYIRFILLRGTEEFSVQESHPLFLLPDHMKAAEQTEKSKMITPCWQRDVLPHGWPRCQSLT